jgi:small multidrug resistance pump
MRKIKGNPMAWLLLILAIFLEVSGTINMKLSHGFTRPVPTVLMFVFYGLGFIPLNLALRRLDVSVAYAVWSGLGMVIVTTIGVLFLKEPANTLKLISAALIILGVVGLSLSGTH